VSPQNVVFPPGPGHPYDMYSGKGMTLLDVYRVFLRSFPKDAVFPRSGVRP